MSQKELLYLEDAISHEDITIDIVTYIINNTKDTKIKSFIKKELVKHEAIRSKLIDTMGSVI